jgi:hypothetical protein
VHSWRVGACANCKALNSRDTSMTVAAWLSPSNGLNVERRAAICRVTYVSRFGLERASIFPPMNQDGSFDMGDEEADALSLTGAVRSAISNGDDAAVADLLVLEAWEAHRPMDLGLMLRVRQIRRANPEFAAKVAAEVAARVRAASLRNRASARH